MRVLWSLPKAAPALLRHLAAYFELAALDFQKRSVKSRQPPRRRRGRDRLFFAVLMGCAAVIAVTWDTPNRLPAIAWMGGGFSSSP